MKREPALDPSPVDAASNPDAEDLVELVLQGRSDPSPGQAPPRRIDGVVIGVLVGFGEGGIPLVDHPESTSGALLPARSATPLSPADVGCEVALLFEGGVPDRPLVIGKMFAPVTHPPPAAAGAAEEAPSPRDAAGRVSVTGDGERLELTAEREIVLRCGHASITLTRAGKVLVRGAYVLTRSTGVNRIQGGSVEIN